MSQEINNLVYRVECVTSGVYDLNAVPQGVKWMHCCKCCNWCKIHLMWIKWDFIKVLYKWMHFKYKSPCWFLDLGRDFAQISPKSSQGFCICLRTLSDMSALRTSGRTMAQRPTRTLHWLSSRRTILIEWATIHLGHNYDCVAHHQKCN